MSSRPDLADLFTADAAMRNELRLRGFDVARIPVDDYEQVLRDGTMPPRFETGVKTGEPPVPAPRLFANNEASKHATTNGNGKARAIAWQRLSDVEMRSIVFVDKPLLQADALHLLVGRKGQGKGTLLSDIAARVTRGELGDKRNVVWIGSEDSAAIDIHPRIAAAGGDTDRVLIVKHGWIQLPRDLDEISRKMDELGDVGMVVIDPVANHFAAGKNTSGDIDVREVLAPLNDFADRHKTMIYGVRHLTEKECSRGILAGIMGASAWVQVPRVVLAVVKDSEDESVSHVQCIAGNRLPPGTPGRMFRIEGTLLPDHPEVTTPVTRAVWIGASTDDVEEILARQLPRAQRVNSGALQELILNQLATGEKSREYLDTVCKDEAGAKPDSVYKSGLSPLKKAGKIKARKDGMSGGWHWRLDD